MRRRLLPVFRLLASGQLALTLMISWIALLLVWGAPSVVGGRSAAQIQGIVDGPSFRIVYAGVLVALAACLAMRLPQLLRRTMRLPTSASVPRHGGTPDNVLPGHWDDARAVLALDALGMKTRVAGEGWAWGVRNRFSTLGDVIFHVVVLVAIGAAALAPNAKAGFEGTAVVNVGETFDSRAGSPFADVRTPAATVPRVSFVLDSLEPIGGKGVMQPGGFEGVVRDASGRVHRITPGAPWIATPTTLVSMMDMGYSATVQATASSGTTPTLTSYRLSLLPVGQRDSFDLMISGITYRVQLELAPEPVGKNRASGVESLDSAQQRVVVSVRRVLESKGTIPVVTGRLVSLGSPIELGGDAFTLTALPRHGELRISRNPFALIALIGVVLVGVSVAMKLCFPRMEVLLVGDDSGIRVFALDRTYRHVDELVQSLDRAWGTLA